jgi:hypothetical protein
LTKSFELQEVTIIMTARTMKLTINLIFLSISIFLSTYFMVQLTDNYYIRVGIAVFAIGLEAAMQYVLALGKAYFKRYGWAKLQAMILFVCYALYILIYNIPLAIGFFATEIDTQEQAAAKVEMVDTINRQKLLQINQTIDNLNRQLAAESKTGYGARSKAIMEQLDKLSVEQFKLQKSFSETSGQTSKTLKVQKNVFGSLGKVLGVPANFLKVVIFGTSIAMLCLILIITSWDIKIDTDTVSKPVAATRREAAAATADPVEDKSSAVMADISDVVDMADTAGQEAPLTESTDKGKRELITYVNAAIRGTGKLNGNERVAEQTGIPLEKCDRFKGWLIEQELVKKGQGASAANFPKSVILEKVQA